MKTPILAVAALMAGSTLGLAQTTSNNPPAPPSPTQIVTNTVNRLTTLLGLSATQQGEATTIFTTEQTALANIRTSMQAAHTALQTAIKNNDANGITTQATQIGTLTGQQVAAEATAAAQFYKILDPEQQSKYNVLGPLGMGGPGGFGGRGPHGGRGPR
jgi:Spy/CpxP family protein refolding chaperone